MRNCIILGSGRSGTSMLGGTLSSAGYFMGDRLYPGRESNPKGFFESSQINGLNEALLAQVLPRRPLLFGRHKHADRPVRAQRWLARVPVGTMIPCSPSTGRRMERLVRRAPFCFKDPRFCYTLPAWRPYLKGTVFLCVFRDPAVTAASILKECQTMAYLRSLAIDFDVAVEVWTLMYRHVLETHRHQGHWLFVHYDQILYGDGLDRIEQAVGATVERNFPDEKLKRSGSTRAVPEQTRLVYEDLCRLAGYETMGKRRDPAGSVQCAPVLSS